MSSRQNDDDDGFDPKSHEDEEKCMHLRDIHDRGLMDQQSIIHVREREKGRSRI